MKRALFLILALAALSCGQKKDDQIPLEMQLDFSVAQSTVTGMQPSWQKAQTDYKSAMNAIVKFCKDHGDRVPNTDPANPKRLTCTAKPPDPKGKK